MVDENVVDQVWVTVVATGYGERPIHRTARGGDTARAALEADAEPRVSRAPSANGSSLSDIDIPEFLPRG
jgi:cell division protein FtsZ